MKIKQWEDKNLSHYSYAILSECEQKIILVDPARNPAQYLAYAAENDATIAGIIETHPHADFVSSHLEIAQTTGAKIYVSKLVNADFEHTTFDEGDEIILGKIRLTPLNTPGHSPDSISILMEHEGKQKAVFTGDTLFIGDCGRPDLRESAGNIKSTRAELASKMYHSLRDKLATLDGEVLVYPAHGAGTLCGKALSDAASSTIAVEKMTNWSLQESTEADFVKELLQDQPFVPAYFPFDVELNRQGAPAFDKSIKAIKIKDPIDTSVAKQDLEEDVWIVDTRNQASFKKAHLPQSINLMLNGKLETWLGSIIQPNESFYLAAATPEELQKALERVASIGYEAQVAAAFVINNADETTPVIDVDTFKASPGDYTIVDVRNDSEVKENKIFKDSIAIPLASLRQRINEIPTDKPIVVHCAGGYRSAAGSSVIAAELKPDVPVYDLGEAIKDFS